MQTKPATILVVDDDPGVLMLLRATLSSTKHKIVCCPSPQDAVRELSRTRFDLILTDYMMPGMTGLQLLELSRTSSPDATRFLLTATATLDVALQAMREGRLERLIRKPWGTGALLHSIEEAAYELEVRRALEGGSSQTAAVSEAVAAPAASVDAFEYPMSHMPSTASPSPKPDGARQASEDRFGDPAPFDDDLSFADGPF